MTTTPPHAMEAMTRDMAERCKLCTLCSRECRFLKDNGMPGDIARKLLAGDFDRETALHCNQCGLCTQVCPVRGLDPCAMFMALREAAMEARPALKKRYKPLLAYEKLGLSRPFTFFGVPEGATTLLFPGCNMPGVRPDLVWDCFLALREQDERLGLALHCCAKPTKSLGLTGLHRERMDGLLQRLEATGVSEVLVLCPNCLDTLKGANPGFSVRTVYEVLAERIPEAGPGLERIRTGVHDPCALRGERAVHQAVRTILWNTGSSVAEMGHSMHKALCCGEGGGVPLVRPDYAEAWRERRKEEAKDRRVATYCAGCVLSLGPEVDAVHVLDLALGRETPPVRQWPAAPKTYVNRLMLKKKAKGFFARQA